MGILRSLFLLFTAFAVSAVGAAQSLRFREALDGKTIPAVIKPKDLPAEYWAVKINISGENSILDLYGGAIFAGSFGSDADEERRRAKEAIGQAAEVYWTKGARIEVENQTFLVAYRLNIPVAILGVGGSRGFDTWAMENPLELTLQLIRPEAISRMSPMPSLSPDRMAKAVAAFERSIAEELGVPPGTLVPGGATTRSSQTAALSNVKQIALGVIMYASDYDDEMPPKPSTAHVREIVMPYLKSNALWKTGNPNKSQFYFNPALAGVHMADVNAPAEMPMIYESVAWPDGRRAVAYADGHAKLVSASEWTRLASLLKMKIKKSSVAKAPPPPPKPRAKRR